MAKKIGAILSLSIIGVLIITTIIMANININYGVNCVKPTSVQVVYKNTEKIETTDADKIIELISNASKENSLTALFNGTLNKKAEIKAVSSVGKTVPSNSGYYVRYRYNNPQSLKVGNKDYKDTEGNTVLYDDLLFTVKATEDITLVNVYVIEDNQKSNTYTYYYEVEANFAELYELLNSKYGA